MATNVVTLTVTGESKLSLLLQKVFLSFVLHFYWVGAVVYLDSNVSDNSKV